MSEISPNTEEEFIQSEVRRRIAWPVGVAAVATGSAIGSGVGLYEVIGSANKDKNEMIATLGVMTLGFAAYAINLARKIPGFAKDCREQRGI